MMSSNGIPCMSVAFCVGNSPVTSELSTQRPVTQILDVFFDLGFLTEPTVEQTMVTPVTGDAIAPIMTSL